MTIQEALEQPVPTHEPITLVIPYTEVFDITSALWYAANVARDDGHPNLAGKLLGLRSDIKRQRDAQVS